MRLACSSKIALRVARAPLVRNGNGNRCLHTKRYNAAVIGGGITGLTAAYRLMRDPACKKVTLYESQPRLGGWMQSDKVTLDSADSGVGDLILERGPRTLRAGFPTCLPLLDMMSELDLLDDVVVTAKSSPAATNRYIYYPDHLVRIPQPRPDQSLFENLSELWNTVTKEPLFDGVAKDIFHEYWDPAPGSDQRDESIADFISRRFGAKVADNLVSAVMAGIFAGDIDRLSARTLMGTLRMREGNGSILKEMLLDQLAGRSYWKMDDLLALQSVGAKKDLEYWKSLKSLLSGASVFTLKQGLEQLPRAIAKQLEESEKAEVITSANIRYMMHDSSTGNIMIDIGTEGPQSYHRVISTIKPLQMAKMAPQWMAKSRFYPTESVKHFQADENNYAVTVMVVNLYYKAEDDLDIPRGFGYLIPRSVSYEQNPELALGVIFGNETSVGQDTAGNTKLTVMLGGHWWDGLPKSNLPNHDQACSFARAVLQRHLKISAEPLEAKSYLHVDAIPQYTVGHLGRMHALSGAVRKEFHNRLTLAGSWYGTSGNGVLDCVRQGYLAASYGVGRKLTVGRGLSPWKGYDYENWELEGGIVTSPVRFADIGKSERRVL
ncbi:Protoporphyrinogen oxidase [Aspergillus uvarum CBS 121591]|uniref:Protoporphyrinogen oxidase n=1 Tax=Aspergillus uvarum CBS 121591 TaxID=1448315 RepID=A0A319C049_9EURO|nr:Protoporphyrinogen oxidase [Aspergillus uvarum CBS 121591]PYH77701.1 Protoporphyrinogen oxidase [Aspergillus uvarum CBS 121591]